MILDFVDFHQVSDDLFNHISRATLADNVFGRHYFPPRAKQRTRAKAAPEKSKQIESVTIYKLRIPFHQAFSHALHSREDSDAVVVKVKDSDGRTGFGESLPRSYVTGETTESMIGRIRAHIAPTILREPFAPGWETLEYLQSVLPDWTANKDGAASIIAWNAAFCAVELALLDWSLRADGCALADLLPPARHEIVYSGVISADAPEDAAALAKRMARLGIRQIKVKVGTADDPARLEAVRKAVGDGVELRADANGAWSAEEAVEQLRRLAKFKLAAIEQPVSAGDLAGMKQVRQQSGVPVMADESLITSDHAQQLIELGACDYFNIRLSKNARHQRQPRDRQARASRGHENPSRRSSRRNRNSLRRGPNLCGPFTRARVRRRFFRHLAARRRRHLRKRRLRLRWARAAAENPRPERDGQEEVLERFATDKIEVRR